MSILKFFLALNNRFHTPAKYPPMKLTTISQLERLCSLATSRDYFNVKLIAGWMSSSEKTLDKLLSLISTGGSQKALMSLSVLSQFCSPVAVEIMQEDVAATHKS